MDPPGFQAMSSMPAIHESERPRIGSAAWGRSCGGRLTRSEQVKFALQTVHAQLMLWVRDASSPAVHKRARLDRIDLRCIDLPDTRTVVEALDLLHGTTPPWLCGHTLRTWSWAAILSSIDDLKPDLEALALSCLMHDLALLPADKPTGARVCACFAIEGGRRAARFLAERKWDTARTQVVEEAICLHMNPRVAVDEGVEAHLLHEAAALDVVGARTRDLPAQAMEVVLERHPRVDFEHQMAAAMWCHASNCPPARTAVLWRLGLGRAIQRSSWPVADLTQRPSA